MVERTIEQLKYLEFAQTNIARLHDAATSMKRFALVAFALGGSLARIVNEPDIFGLMGIAIATFFLLDAKYLQAERAFRDIYDRVRDEPPGTPASFDLTPTVPYWLPLREMGSWSTWLLYGPVLAILVALWILGKAPC